jgi:RimJ/RimL family protein N-acetyltransferase
LTNGLDLQRAHEADIPFLMATERIPGYESLVGRWDETRHRAALADPGIAVFVAREHGGPAGFAILKDWGSPDRVTLIKRIAVAQPNHGLGRRLLGALADAVFQETDAFRLCLGLFPENARAYRVYRACGFLPEGVSRGSAYFGGEHRDELVMALLRPDWERLKAP